jgi:hypothetical protein
MEWCQVQAPKWQARGSSPHLLAGLSTVHLLLLPALIEMVWFHLINKVLAFSSRTASVP